MSLHRHRAVATPVHGQGRDGDRREDVADIQRHLDLDHRAERARRPRAPMQPGHPREVVGVSGSARLDIADFVQRRLESSRNGMPSTRGRSAIPAGVARPDGTTWRRSRGPGRGRGAMPHRGRPVEPRNCRPQEDGSGHAGRVHDGPKVLDQDLDRRGLSRREAIGQPDPASIEHDHAAQPARRWNQSTSWALSHITSRLRDVARA